MTNGKSIKRALLSSAFSLVICVAMLIGTTFAWFTDTASTAVNKIQAGNLDVALQMKNSAGKWVSAENGTLDFVKAEGAESEEILWEPGARYKLPDLRVINNGNLALKYKIVISGAKDATPENDVNDLKLLDVIDWTYEVSGKAYTLGEERHLAANGAADTFNIKGTMQTTAGNEYQGMSINGISITVYAAQDTVESDSFDNQYDKNATYDVYPEGVTNEIFAAQTDAEYGIPGGSTGKANAVAAYVDGNGEIKYTADVKKALDDGADTIYLKKNSKGRLMALSDFLAQPNRTADVTKNITIYANGADFEYGELALNTTEEGKNANITVKIYDAKNLKIWGNTPNAGVTQNIILENCHNVGVSATQTAGELVFLYGGTGTVNLTVNNCSVEKTDCGIYVGCDGSLTVKGSSFTECATGIKSSYKGNGTRTDRIEDCVFTKCGCTEEMANGTAWLSDDSAAFKYKISSGASGKMSLTLKNNTITGTIGDKGDTQIAEGVTVVNE